MTLQELVEHVERNDRYEAEEASIEGPDGEPIKGVIVTDKDLGTAVHVKYGTMLKLDWDKLRILAACGKDVDHITRTTGYFSRVSQWNPGKLGELKDRHRVEVK